MKRRAFSKKKTRRASRRGVALILVLGALTILTVMLTEAQDESSADFASALAARDELVAEYSARSAVNLSRLIIAAEPTIRLGLGMIFMALGQKSPGQIPIWAHTDKALGAFNDEDAQKAFSALAAIDTKAGKNLGMQGAGFEVRVIDEDSKLDLNAPAHANAVSELNTAAQLLGLMNGPQYDPLFSQRDADGQFSDRMAICSAIIDWVDPNQDQANCDPTQVNATSAPPEDSFYSLLAHPYERKNAAFDSLEELRRVRGMSEDFWATFIDPDPDDPDKRVVTVWGQGKVNVNTANPQILLALVCNPRSGAPTARICTDPTESAKFLMALSMVRGFTAGAPLFPSPKAFVAALKGKEQFGSVMTMLGIEPVELLSPTEFADGIATESKVFSIYATGYVRQGKRETRTRIHAVVDFRDAPPPGTDARALGATKDALQAQADQQPDLDAPPNAAGAALQQIEAALKPSPGGAIIYYRVD